VGVVLLDCGTGLQEPASQSALRTSDQVVLVSDAEPATASLVTEAAALLRREEVPISLVVNNLGRRPTGRLDLAALENYIPQARGLVTVAPEPRAARAVTAGAFDWRDAPPAGGWPFARWRPTWWPPGRGGRLHRRPAAAVAATPASPATVARDRVGDPARLPPGPLRPVLLVRDGPSPPWGAGLSPT
jgi:hypothetical protein